MNKLKSNKHLQIIIPLILIVLGGIVLKNIFPGEIVQIYGDRSFKEADVYVNDKYVAVMTWDEEKDRTYAKDVSFFKQFSIKKGLEKRGINRDSLKFKRRGGDIELKVVTKNNQIYQKQYINMEDISYFPHDLNDFELVEE